VLLSPTGKPVCPSTGPLDAEIVFIAESPAKEEMLKGEPLVGKSGRLLNQALRSAGLDRSKLYLAYVVPIRAPGDKFAQHDPSDVVWGIQRLRQELSKLTNAKVIIALGANPTQVLLGSKPPVAQYSTRDKEGFISQWRGSVIPATLPGAKPEDYLSLAGFKPLSELCRDSVVIPTWHPAAILRQFTWHSMFVSDLQRAAKIAREGLPALTYRQWFINEPLALQRLFSDSGSPIVDLISIDTEMEPAHIVGIATEDEVHVFEFSETARPLLTKLLESPKVLKVAHNLAHDYAFTRKVLGIEIARPYFDTMGAAHVLNNALPKELSPHIATRYTDWAYHKWLYNVDPYVYNGMDAIVCYDAYWNQLAELAQRQLYWVANHDHQLLTPLMEMQAKGFRIDETERKKVELELKVKLDAADVVLQQMVEPVIAKRVASFKKPHLFQVQRKCPCCGGGELQRNRCLACSGYAGKTVKQIAEELGYTQKAIREEFLFPCGTCEGSGKVTKNLEFNSESSDQIADVVYRGLRIVPRRYKGSETVKAAQLDPIKDRHPIIAQIVEVSKLRADYETVYRLSAGPDGRLHCVFDPFGTGTGRVSSKGGLVEPGTNAMNLPEEARRFIVPDDGYVFIYPDMAQIEARAVAVLSGDKGLMAAFTEPVDWPGHPKHGQIDSHTKVVQMMLKHGFEISRDQAKRLVYAAMWGARAKQLATELNAEAFRKGEGVQLSVEQVQLMLDTFFKAFPGVLTWRQRVLEEVQRTRRLRCPLVGRESVWLGYIMDSKTKEIKYEIAKQIWAFLPQHLAAWILALGLLDMYYRSGEWGNLLQPLVHVHDALLIQVPVSRFEEAKALAQQLLTREQWGILFPAEMKQGRNWYEASVG